MSADQERIQTLGRRVRWLDRYRRAISIACAILLAPITMTELGELLGTDWPRFHATLLGLMIAAITWWTIEVGLAWLTAVWETECDRLLRDRGLPHARVLPRRKTGH